jgi:hypothetical protein
MHFLDVALDAEWTMLVRVMMTAAVATITAVPTSKTMATVVAVVVKTMMRWKCLRHNYSHGFLGKCIEGLRYSGWEARRQATFAAIVYTCPIFTIIDRGGVAIGRGASCRAL